MLNDRIRDMIEPLIQAKGFILWDCELHNSGRHSLLRITIDGVSLDDCALLSREISAILDVEDPIKAEYHLEISSPGVNRVLSRLTHFEKYIGSEVKIKLRPPYRKNGLATIEKVAGDKIFLSMDNETLEVELGDIQKCELRAI